MTHRQGTIREKRKEGDEENRGGGVRVAEGYRD